MHSELKGGWDHPLLAQDSQIRASSCSDVAVLSWVLKPVGPVPGDTGRAWTLLQLLVAKCSEWGIHPCFLSRVKSKVFPLCTFLPTEAACWALSYNKVSSRYCLCIWNSPLLKARHQQIQHVVPLEYEILWWECKHPHNNRWRGKCWTLLSVLNCGWVDLELSIRDKNIRHFITGN